MAESVRVTSVSGRGRERGEQARRVSEASEASTGVARQGRERKQTWTTDDTLMEQQTASASRTSSSCRSSGVPVNPPRVVRIPVSGGGGREVRRLRRGHKTPSMKAGPVFYRRLVKSVCKQNATCLLGGRGHEICTSKMRHARWVDVAMR